ncbi:fibronectin type III domain-containing protein [Reichenbachiella agariperforans]|uniref:fibronectin type III domain-containing protein n=1 Tax=Reichenbachiella agariperforans TaxID=156994 RepID=UPI001C0900F1|nr:fibronectin type III domain-containing protein [Reichenbachiella agariperforans]MBU2914759.1 fibronectin type III domain-containing protein [Reichenbachiella agariperforans]
MSNQSRFHIHPRAFQFIRQLWQWCFFVVLLTAGYHGQGQTYPVQVTTTLLPPYSPELSYYSSAEVNNMQVFVHVLELDRVDYRAKLRLTIEGAGVRLTTLPSYVPNPLVLQGGVPLMLSGFDLRHYLNPDHLAFEGMTKADFMRNGRLPEGFYTFTIEVLDYTRGVRVSNASMATAWIVLNDPPLINFPINADKIKLSEPQFVNFSWLGRHLASPNAAFSTEYEFSLYEMLPGQTSPDAAVRSSNTIYRTTTTQSSLLYGPAEPLLEPGKKYAFRVQAYDVSGRDLFKNQGYSETYWFQYGDECMPVKFLAGEALDDSRIKVTWESEMSHTGFTLQYREKGKSSWHTEQALFGAQVIPDLQANTEYEYQVAGKCLNYIGDYSTIQTVKTEERASGPEDEGTYACGEEGEASDLNPTPLEKTLRTLDQFEIGGIDVIILEATKGSDGSYTGTGYSPLPIFKGAGLKVSIENVIINEDYKAIAGKVVTTYDEEGSFIFGSHDEREPEGEDVPNGIEDLPTVVVTIPVEIASVTVADGVVTVLDETGTPVSLESTALPAEGNTLTLEDASGDQWLVDSEGNVQKAEPTAASQAAGTAPAAISADEDVDFSITFEAYTDQKFGFDDPKQPFDKTTTGLSAGYTQKQVQEENHWVAWKSVATGQTDWVTATHDAGEALPAYVGFKTTTGELASQPSEQEQSKAITVLGKSNQHTETVTAYVKQEDEEGNETEKTLGVLQVISYDQVRERVIIVPVNDATVPDAYTVGEALNRIYGQAVAHWEVEVSSSYQVEAEILTQLDEGESGILSSFPSNMQGFNRDYKRSLDNYDKDAYYLFLIPGSDSDRAGLSADRAGFMPFKRQFGYIWTDKTSNQSTTIAHELGHGAFRLRHTFSTENFVAGERTTDNLMDYKGGTQLYKHQWDFVHDPESMNGWAQEDEESAYYNTEKVKKIITHIQSNNNKSRPTDLILETSNIVSEKDLNDAEIIKKYLGEFEALNNTFLTSILNDYHNDDAIQEVLKEYNDEKLYSSEETPYNQQPVLLAKSIELDFGESENLVTPLKRFTITMYGYSMTKSIITHYAEKKKSPLEITYIFYNGYNPEKKQNPGESHMLSNRKAISISIPIDQESSFETFIGLKGIIEFNQITPNTHNEEIKIIVKREKSNEFITVGSIKVEGTNIKGVILELGIGTAEESNTICTDVMRNQYACKRIPSGTYEFELNTEVESSQGQHVFRSLRIKPKEGVARQGILIHRGTSYSFSRGCLLAMYTSQLDEILQNPHEFFYSGTMGYNATAGNVSASEIFNMALYEYIKEVDPNGDRAKTLVIEDNDDGSDPGISLSEFQLRKKAGEYYYSLNVADKADELIEALPVTLVERLLIENGVIQAVEQRRLEIDQLVLNGQTFSSTQIDQELVSAWENRYAEVADQITKENIMAKYNETTDFVTPLKNFVQSAIEDNENSRQLTNKLFENISLPGAPVFHVYLKEDRKTNKNKVEIEIEKQLANMNDEIQEIMRQVIQ